MALPSLAGMNLCIVPYQESKSHSFEEEAKYYANEFVSPQTAFNDDATKVMSPGNTYNDTLSAQSTYGNLTNMYSEDSIYDDIQR
jgi:hypothetical protein